MKCNSCGYENIEEAVDCSNCKQPVSSAVVVSPVVDAVPASTPSPYAAPPQSKASTQGAAPVASPYAQSAAPAPSTPPSQPSPPAYSSSPSYNATPVRPAPYTYQQPYYYPPVTQRQKPQFTITDVYIIIGFVLAVIGIFAYSFLLLPASIGFSIVGFVKRTNARTLGLSIAGIVVGVVACLIKIGMVLNELGVIPDWLSAGIF